MNAATPGRVWRIDAIGAGSQGASYWAANIASTLSALKPNYSHVLYDIGVNDFSSATQAQWIADVLTTADAVNAKWPNALFIITYPWKRSFDSTAATFHTWVDSVIASRSFIRAGDDEAVWLKGSDNGTTNTSDGTHFLDPAGQAGAALARKTALGY